MMGIIFWSLWISVAINGIMFLIAFKVKSDKLTDISYALTFITLALFVLYNSKATPYIVIAVGLVCIWALRIGSFLLYRVLRTGIDRRFDGIRDDFWKFGRFWIGQALTVWILMLPIAFTSSGDKTWNASVLIGITIWFVGFVLESVADLQKYHFTQNSANKDRWIDSGIWYYSRHPNYFGEILVWVGIYLYAFPELSVVDRTIGVCSPLLIITLLLFVSGIPVLEKSADKRWGTIVAYKDYKKRTSILIPFPRKRISH